MRQRSNLEEHRYVRQYALAASLSRRSKTGIGRDLAPVREFPEQALGPQGAGKTGANALVLEQHPNRLQCGTGGRSLLQELFTLRLHGLDLPVQQLDDFQLEQGQRLEMFRKRPPVSGAQRLQAFPAFLVPRLVPADPLREEQTLQPVYMTDTLSDQSLQFPAKARRSSSSGVGTQTIEQTRGSPPFPRHE